MSKMIDVLTHAFVQNFPYAIMHDDELTADQLTECVLNVPEQQLKEAIAHLFHQVDAQETALALEISAERMAELQAGVDLQQHTKLEDTLKVVALGLAIETNTLQHLEISDCLVDYLV